MLLLAFRDDANPLAKLRPRPLSDHLVAPLQGLDLTISLLAVIREGFLKLLSRLSS
jgi:hypothetical protein